MARRRAGRRAGGSTRRARCSDGEHSSSIGSREGGGQRTRRRRPGSSWRPSSTATSAARRLRSGARSRRYCHDPQGTGGRRGCGDRRAAVDASVGRRPAASRQPNTITLWAQRPLTIRQGCRIAVRMRGDQLQVRLVDRDRGLSIWRSADGLTTEYQAEHWAATSKANPGQDCVPPVGRRRRMAAMAVSRLSTISRSSDCSTSTPNLRPQH